MVNPSEVLTPKQIKDREAYLKQQQEEDQKKFSVPMTRLQLRVIFNILISKEYKLGDALLVSDIVHKIEPYVVSESNIPVKDQPLVLGGKES